jgi:hypothetical protein
LVRGFPRPGCTAFERVMSTILDGFVAASVEGRGFPIEASVVEARRPSRPSKENR